MGFKELCPGVPQKFSSGFQKSRVFPSHRNSFQTLNINILTFPQCDETSTGVGQPSTGYEDERLGEGEEDV